MAQRLGKAAVLFGAALLFPLASFGAGTRHQVIMEGTRFVPETLTVKPGDTVVWVNRDFFPHTATAQSGQFDSKSISVGKTWAYRPKARGEFPYFCVFHPTMRATLKVE